MKITINGNPSELEGVQPTVGAQAPAFTVKTKDGKEFTKANIAGAKTLISVFPNINTSVCDVQTRKFFELASKMEGVKVLNISNNTIDELTSWCSTTGVDVEMLSDEGLSFAKNYGLFIPELGLLTRSIFVIDESGIIKYMEIVPEVVSEPNYDAALAAL